MQANVELSSGHRTGTGQFSFQSQRKEMQRMFKYHTIALNSHASIVMLKILQARLQQYVNHELPDVRVQGLVRIYARTGRRRVGV